MHDSCCLKINVNDLCFMIFENYGFLHSIVIIVLFGKDTYEGMRTRKIKNTSTPCAGLGGGGSLLSGTVPCPCSNTSPMPRLRADAGVVGTAAWPVEASTAVASHGIQSADSGMAAVAQ